MIGIVRGEDNSEAVRLRQGAGVVEHGNLVAEIEAGGGFVKNEEFRLLRQRAGEQDQLPLAAGNLGHRLVAQMRDAQCPQCLFGAGAVGAGGRGKGAVMRGAAHQRHVEHAEREGRLVALRHIGGGAGKALRRPVRDIFAAQKNLPGNRREPAQGLQQRGLARAVGAEQEQDFARLQFEIDAVHDAPAIAPRGEVSCHEQRRHDQPFRAMDKSR